MSLPRERQLLIGLAVVVAVGVAAFFVSQARSTQQQQQHEEVATPVVKKKKKSGSKKKKPASPPPSPKAAPAPTSTTTTSTTTAAGASTSTSAGPPPTADTADASAAAAADATPATEVTAEAETKPAVVDKKQEFDDANRLAQKFYKGEHYKKAAEYFTKCIELIDDLPEYTSKLQLMFNNRSAMYEKLGELEKSLADITVLLTLNKQHTKSRVRRARIWESQGKLRDALTELCVVLAQAKDMAMAGKQIPDMTSEVAKLEELVERIVQEELPLAKKAAAKHRGLPAKYLLKQFFASFKEYREQKTRLKDAQLDALVQAMHQSHEEGGAQARVQALLDLALYYTSVDAYKVAFETTQDAQRYLSELSAEEKASVDRVALAQLQDTVATYLHLNNDLTGAGEFYREALKSLDEAEAAHDAAEESNADAMARIKYLQALVNVKYGMSLVDGDKAEEAQQYYDRAAELDPDNMDVYVHRSQLWHSLKQPEKSLADLELAVAKDPTVATSHVRLGAAWLMLNPERANVCLQLAKELAPNDIHTACLEAEILCTRGDIRQALELTDRASRLNPENPLPLISTATIYMQILQFLGGQLPDGSQVSHEDMLAVCNKILEIDPNNETAYVRKARIGLLLAKTYEEGQVAIKIFQQAIRNCRSLGNLRMLIQERELCNIELHNQFLTGI